MTLPTALLDAAAAHRCFPGVFGRGNAIRLYPGLAGPSEIVDFQCDNCLLFRIACAAADLPTGMTHEQAALEITAHVRALRGYRLSVAGYHTSIGGWLSAAYWNQAGIFVLRADRGSSASKTPLSVLIDALTRGPMAPLDPAMLDPAQYAVQDVFLSVVPPPSVTSLAGLLASAHVSPTKTADHQKVTLAAFLPAAPAPSAPSPPVSPAGAAPSPTVSVPAEPALPLQPGERCPTCGQTVGERWLFTTHYTGCGCG